MRRVQSVHVSVEKKMPLPIREPVHVSDERLIELLDLAEQALNAARSITLRWFRQPIDVDDKRAGEDGQRGIGITIDPVTRADREAEQCIRDVLLEGAPDIGFLGEETGTHESRDGLLWVVDPIDGTRAYISGMPMWGTLIALSNGHAPLLGLLDQPVLEERFVGYGQEAYLKDSEKQTNLRTRQDRILETAVLYCTSPEMFTTGAQLAAFERVRSRVALSRFGGDCYAYAMLASGHVDLIVESDLQPYDIQALIPIVTAAGGVVSNWEGGSAAAGGSIVAAGSRRLHEQALIYLNG